MSKILLEMIRNIVNDLSLVNHKLNQESIDKNHVKKLNSRLHVKNIRRLKDQNTRKLNQKLIDK